MYVKIGKYRNWFGPYQCADLLRYLGFSKDFCEWVGDRLGRYQNFFEWIDSFKQRKVKVQIHNYDTWSMDHTLALIIHPMLVQLRATSHGAPLVDDEDVPNELKSTSALPKEFEWDTDSNFFKRWDYVLDEMIFTFHAIVMDEEDLPAFGTEQYDAYYKRLNNGLCLFGKYYRGLWD